MLVPTRTTLAATFPVRLILMATPSEGEQTRGKVARFLHLDRVFVRRGQKLTAGARIGAVGSTGRSSAPHLHYEIRKFRSTKKSPVKQMFLEQTFQLMTQQWFATSLQTPTAGCGKR